MGALDGPFAGWSHSMDAERLRRGFLLAYGTAVVANLVSASLTYVYVPVHATELNPVVSWLIEAFGAGGMVVVKSAVVVAAYWGYALVTRVVGSSLALPFAWTGALVHVLDALHDLRVAALAGSVPLTDAPALVTAVVVVSVAATLLRPPSPVSE